MKKEALFLQHLKRRYGITNVQTYLPTNYLGFHYYIGNTRKRKKVFIKREGCVKHAAAREACILKILNHQPKSNFFPRLLAYQAKGCFPFVATGFIRGLTLDKFLLYHQPDHQEKKKLLHEMTLILNVLHGTKIVHRDIRPSNLMVQAGQDRLRLILIDFAYAVRLRPNPLPELAFLAKNKPIRRKLGRDFRPAQACWDDAYSFRKIAQIIEPQCREKFPRIWSALSSSIGKVVFR
ncbi:MAG TPA: protein kinase family protein [Firmicutes bacterium]|nr:protein kinase family protein [Bacillota bacterium]